MDNFIVDCLNLFSVRTCSGTRYLDIIEGYLPDKIEAVQLYHLLSNKPRYSAAHLAKHHLDRYSSMLRDCYKIVVEVMKFRVRGTL